MNYEKMQKCKIVYFNKAYEFCLTQYLIKSIFFVSIPINTIKILKFYIFNKMCEIWNEHWNEILFAWMSSTNSRQDIFWQDVYFVFLFLKTLLKNKSSVFQPKDVR